MTHQDLPTARGNAEDQPTREVNLLLTGIPGCGKHTHLRRVHTAGHIPAQRTAGGDRQW